MSTKPREKVMVDGEACLRCPCCERLLPETEEYWYIHDGYVRSRCRECATGDAKARNAATRSDAPPSEVVVAQLAFLKAPAVAALSPLTWAMGDCRAAA